MSWKTKYCEALALVPYAIDKDINEVNLCEETRCVDCIFLALPRCDAVTRMEYFEEHFDELFSKEVNKMRPALGITSDYIGGCGSEIDCFDCIFNINVEDCQRKARNVIWEKIDEENRESRDTE